MDLPVLRAAGPEVLHSGANAFGRAAQALARATDRLELEVLRPLMDGAWRGVANAAAVAYVEQVWKDLVRARADLERADRAVWQLAEAVAAAQRMVAEAERIVESAQLVLAPDGSIQIPPSLPWPTTEEDEQVRQQAAERAHLLLNEALASATEADLTTARTLAELVADLVGSGAGGGGGGIWGDGDGSGDGSDDGDLLGTVWDALSWTSSISSFIEANWGIGGLGSVPVLGKVLAAVSGIGAVQGVMDLIEQGNPIDAYQERGAEYVADGFETAFNASSVAFALAPDPFSKLVAGAAVVTTGIGWAVSDNWNSIPFHDNIEDAVGWAADTGSDAAGWAWDTGSDAAGWAWDTGSDAAGAAWDTGTDAAGAVWDTGTDALGGLANAGGDLLGSVL